MTANSKWQDVISQNLAAASIPGYKKQEVSFDSVAAGVLATEDQSTALMFPKAGTSVNFTSGEMKYTGGKTDVAIQGGGFFTVEMPNGNNVYTRDGEFQIDSKGQLVTKTGEPVVTDRGTVTLDARDPSPVSISSNGQISQGSVTKGRLKIVEFSDPTELQSVGGGYYSDAKTTAVPTVVDAPSLRQGFLESANTSAVTEMTSLISAMRAFETNQRVAQMQDERMGRAISELGTPS
jgi:flagellar basal body rod protein FlgG